MKIINNLVPIVSFPRSGNTWTRLLLANILKKDPILKVDYKLLNILCPATITNKEFHLDETKNMLIDGSPIFVKEHVCYQLMPKYNYSKSIYIKRNRLDVLKSFWTFLSKRNPGLFPDIETYLKYYGYIYGTWEKHVDSWVFASKNSKDHSVYIMDYEDLVKDTKKSISLCLDYLEINVDEDIVSLAVKDSKYEKISQLPQNKIKNGNIYKKSELDNKDFDSIPNISKNDTLVGIIGRYYLTKYRIKRIF